MTEPRVAGGESGEVRGVDCGFGGAGRIAQVGDKTQSDLLTLTDCVSWFGSKCLIDPETAILYPRSHSFTHLMHGTLFWGPDASDTSSRIFLLNRFLLRGF